MLREAYDLTEDEVRFYLILGRNGPVRIGEKDVAGYEKMIKKYRPVYWRAKELLGEVVVKPAEKVKNRDLQSVLENSDGIREYPPFINQFGVL